MTDLREVIAKDLADYYVMVRDQVHHWVDPLTQEQIWKQPFAHGNTVGHLLLHMTGNLNYYIGARVAGTDYVRDRDREFTEPEPRPKTEMLAAFDRVISLVIETIEKQSAEEIHHWPVLVMQAGAQECGVIRKPGVGSHSHAACPLLA